MYEISLRRYKSIYNFENNGPFVSNILIMFNPNYFYICYPIKFLLLIVVLMSLYTLMLFFYYSFVLICAFLFAPLILLYIIFLRIKVYFNYKAHMYLHNVFKKLNLTFKYTYLRIWDLIKLFGVLFLLITHFSVALCHPENTMWLVKVGSEILGHSVAAGYKWVTNSDSKEIANLVADLYQTGLLFEERGSIIEHYTLSDDYLRIVLSADVTRYSHPERVLDPIYRPSFAAETLKQMGSQIRNEVIFSESLNNNTYSSKGYYYTSGGPNYTRGRFWVSDTVKLFFSGNTNWNYSEHIIRSATETLDVLKAASRDPLCENPFTTTTGTSQKDPLLEHSIKFDRDIRTYSSRTHNHKTNCLVYGVLGGVILTVAILNHHYDVL